MAQHCGVAQANVSSWEKGVSEPNASAYVQLGAAAGNPECWYFWAKLGFTEHLVLSSLPPMGHTSGRPVPHFEVIASRGALQPGSTALKKRTAYVALPLLKDTSSLGHPHLIEEADVEDIMFFRSKLVPHPDSTVCVHVHGDAMSPILQQGYTAVVDEFTVNPRDLYDSMVVVRDPQGKIAFRWLRETNGEPMLVAQYTSPRHPVVLLNRAKGWTLIGKVLFWIGHPAQPGV